eukprot:m.68479 g.68479  ORF g.68479 m.68479 type:complete len:497 (-) comp13682_c0_seq9:83-1573(-)
MAELCTPTRTARYEDGLQLDTFYLECLAQASYLVSHEGHAFLIDPRRDVEPYLSYLEANGLQLKGILETHVHADFVSGHLELHRRLGTTIFVGEQAGAQFPHHPCKDGEFLELSNKYAIKALSTPGHTFGCVTWVLVHRDIDRAVKAFTGDTLFVGGNGRPDLVGALRPDATPELLSRLMFASIHEKLAHLPDDCEVLPAHGPGSPCGKGISSELSSTIGKEKLTNPAFTITDEVSFVEYNIKGLGRPPQYFSNAVMTNQQGAKSLLSDVQSVRALSVDAFKAQMHDGVVVLDTRDATSFARAHIEGSVNIPIGQGGGVRLAYEDGNFAIWVGTLIPPKTKILLIAPNDKEQEVLERLGRIGYTCQVIGLLKFGFGAWLKQEQPFDTFERLQVQSAATVQSLQEAKVVIVDTRTVSEYACTARGHVQGAINLPLAELPQTIETLDKSRQYVVYCLAGFRSIIATSLMRRYGLNAVDVQDGYERGILAKASEVTTSE